MAHEPDLRFDIDALFEHITEDLDRDPDTEESEWHFSFRSDSVDELTRVGETLADDFDVFLQEAVEEVTESGSSVGPPLLGVVIQAALSREEVKELAARFAALAEREGLEYEGVTVFEPFDADEAFDWLDLESAQWRLRSFTDSGLAHGEPTPFVFAIDPKSMPVLDRAVGALESAGFRNLEIYDDEDDEDGLGILVHVEGRNDEALLAETWAAVEGIASGAGAELVGVQFFDEEDDEDDDPEDDNDDDEWDADDYADEYADEYGEAPGESDDERDGESAPG